MNNNHKILFLIMLGLVIRLILAFLPGFKIDVEDWFAWTVRLNEVGLAKFYSNQVFSDYTPGYMYILTLLGFFRNLFQISDPIFILLLKLPAIIAEIILGMLIYRQSRVGSLFIFLNPALIFNSAVWGQIDSILALLLFLAIYYLKNQSLVLASILLGAGLLVKPQAIAILPVFVLLLIKNFTIKRLIKSAIPFLLIILLLSLPFFPDKPFTGLVRLIFNTANQYPYTSLFAYNVWGLAGFWINDNTIWNNLSYQHWGYVLFVSYWVFISYLYFKKKLSVYAMATLATLGFFFLPTRVHERYLYPAIVFLILTASLYKSKLLLLLTGLLSLAHFFNLYYVYVYYNEIYFKLPKLLYTPILYNFLAENGQSLSLISLSFFILINVTILKHAALPKKH